MLLAEVWHDKGFVLKGRCNVGIMDCIGRLDTLYALKAGFVQSWEFVISFQD